MTELDLFLGLVNNFLDHILQTLRRCIHITPNGEYGNKTPTQAYWVDKWHPKATNHSHTLRTWSIIVKLYFIDPTLPFILYTDTPMGRTCAKHKYGWMVGYVWEINQLSCTFVGSPDNVSRKLMLHIGRLGNSTIWSVQFASLVHADHTYGS